MHTDIKSEGWVALLPPPVRPYVLLARLDRPAGFWLLLLPGWWAIALAAGGWTGMDADILRLMALFGAGAVIMRAAGCVINDLWDRDLDAKVTRTQERPLASGTLTPRQGLVFLFLLLLAGFAILLQLNGAAIALGILSLPLIAAYPLMKRITWWPQLFLGIVFNFGALMGWVAVTGEVGRPALFLYMAGIFWTLGYDTIYAHQDREDDLHIGVRSTAIRFGRYGLFWVSGFYAAFWLLLCMAFVAAGRDLVSLALLVFAGFHLLRQIGIWNPDDPSSALRAFRSNVDFGLMVFFAAVFV